MSWNILFFLTASLRWMIFDSDQNRFSFVYWWKVIIVSVHSLSISEIDKENERASENERKRGRWGLTKTWGTAVLKNWISLVFLWLSQQNKSPYCIQNYFKNNSIQKFIHITVFYIQSINNNSMVQIWSHWLQFQLLGMNKLLFLLSCCQQKL